MDLENPANWVLRDSQGFTTSENTPLSEYLSIVRFTSNIIGVLVDNSAAKDTWKFAGWAAQRVNAPIGPNSIPTKLNYRRLWLREKQLLVFSSDITNYQITVRFPEWFRQASITVWEYQNLQPF